MPSFESESMTELSMKLLSSKKKKILLILERKKERKKTSFQRVGSRISDNWLARENFSFFRPYSWILVSTRNDERKLELHVGVCLVSLGNRSS